MPRQEETMITARRHDGVTSRPLGQAVALYAAVAIIVATTIAAGGAGYWLGRTEGNVRCLIDVLSLYGSR